MTTRSIRRKSSFKLDASVPLTRLHEAAPRALQPGRLRHIGILRPDYILLTQDTSGRPYDPAPSGMTLIRGGALP